jgi:hypothetical protein
VPSGAGVVDDQDVGHRHRHPQPPKNLGDVGGFVVGRENDERLIRWLGSVRETIQADDHRGDSEPQLSRIEVVLLCGRRERILVAAVPDGCSNHVGTVRIAHQPLDLAHVETIATRG